MLTFRLLPSSFNADGCASARQHYSCYIVNGCVAIDAGSLASGCTEKERSRVRDIVLTHAHLDHIAGLPLFIDDLFPILTEPVRVHASEEVIDVLENHVFNWNVYPRFSEIHNEFGPVIQYCRFPEDLCFDVQDIRVKAIPVNHKVPSFGYLIDHGSTKLAFTGDTAAMSAFWDVLNECGRVDALLIECAFPNEFDDLASVSHHLTPGKLEAELGKIRTEVDAIYVSGLKPAYRDVIVDQLENINDSRLHILEVGREYQLG